MPKVTGQRVLITGAGGFIGRWAPPAFEKRGFEVHSLTSQPGGEHTRDPRWYHHDLLGGGDIDSVMSRVRPSHLLHLAWITTPGAYWTSDENHRWVDTSVKMLHSAARHGCQRIVMAGSCAEYDWGHGLCSEDDTPLEPATLYGRCKVSLAETLDAFGRQEGISTAWGRIFFLFGPYEHPERLVPSIIRAILDERPAECTHGNQERDFLYSLDVADAFAALVDSPVEGAVNIGSGDTIQIKDLATTIAKKMGRPDLLRLGARPAPPGEPPVLRPNVTRLRDHLGWRPTETLDSGLEKTIDWWRNSAIS